MINAAGQALLKAFEGLHQVKADGLVHPYHDPVGYPTIGYGHLLSTERWADLSRWPAITRSLAEDMLVEDLQREAVLPILRLVKVQLTENQLAALASFTFNLGAGALRASSLLRLLNREEYQEAADQFLRWNKAGGQVLRGLTRRRVAERELFLSGAQP